jgi:trans-aconitate 2-methyltransferase
MSERRAQSAWSAAQYLKFEDERTRPARELLARVPLDAARLVVDLGCGPATSTALLAERFPQARIVGVDSDADMLANARKRLPRATYVEADIVDWTPERGTDLVYSNATFQWVPDHLGQLARLLGRLAPGGVLAAQMPDNMAEPAQTLMREAAHAGAWIAKLGAAMGSRDALHGVGEYYDRLVGLSARLDIWHTHYQHRMDSAAAIVEWFKGSSLRPFLDPLNETERRGFIAAYESRLAEAYPERADGARLLRFPRLFLVAVRG